MSILHSIYLGIIQGIAEFLPISSSGHLQIAQNIFNLEEVPLLFDIFLHLATLLAVCIVFWKKIWELLKCLGRWITKKEIKASDENYENDFVLCKTDKAGRKTIIAIIISTIITGIIGIITSKFLPELSVKFVCIGFLITSALLIFSFIYEKKQEQKSDNNEEGVSIKQSIIIGIMQGIGTLPGISRSGSTISASLFSKLDRKSAGDYSFIISIPAILGAFVLDLKDLDKINNSIGFLPVLTGCLTAFIVGLISLKLLLKIINKGKLIWFAAYLIPAGILGLIFF